MSPQDASAVLDALGPALKAAAKNVLFHAYGSGGLPWGTSFEQLEELACSVADRLACEVLTAAVQRQAQNQLPNDLRTCPCCGGPVEDKPAQTRTLHTSRGDIAWQQPQAYCPRCRRAFSPSGQEPGT